MRRIAIIGPVASGKSTLARYLGSRLDLPVVELDEIYWGGASFSDSEWAEVHRRLLEPGRWIISGDYRTVAGERFVAADTIVWLDLSRPLCWWRAWRRQSSVSKMACFRWIWRYPRHGRKQTLATLAEQGGGANLFQLRSRRAVRRFMTEVMELAGPSRGGGAQSANRRY